MKKIIRYMLGFVLAAAVMAAAGAACWDYVCSRPCFVKMDCRGLGIDVETMKRWEKREEKGGLGIINMAGWSVGEQQLVSSVSTGRKHLSNVVLVYGSMELAVQSQILEGRCGLDVEGNFCVLSEGLARHLFGSTDVTGECVKTEKQVFLVAGVTGEEEDILMIPMESGEVEELAVVFNGRLGAKEKMRRLVEQ
ncbi:MAG: ABC transporter permease [Hungatella sp.]|nr:ABC transporter permease [Hungatella sp.]